MFHLINRKFLFSVCLLSIAFGCSDSAKNTASSEAAEEQVDDSTAQAAVPETPPTPKAMPPLELEELPDPDGSAGTYSISQVMQLAHENRLFRRLMTDSPDMAAAERLLVLYEALPKQQPPKGEPESWEKRSTALITATKAVIDGSPDGTTAFKKAVNCQGCHSNHRT